MFEREAPPLSVAEIVDDPDQAAAWLAADRPGPDRVAAISMLDPATLSHAGRVDLLVALERHLAWLSAAQQRVLASMADHPHEAADPFDRTGASWVREDVACALRLSGITAQRRLAVAETLTGPLRATLRLLDRGAISYLHALTLAESTYGLDYATTASVEDRALRRAPQETLAQFKASVRRAVAAADPATIEAQREHAMTERRVCISPREDGMAELWALLPAEGAAALITAVDALASVTSADDARSADQRRADALVDLGVAALHDPLLPRAQGMRPSVQVTVALSTLLGLDEQPAELTGHGPIPATLARRIAADPTGTWRRLITDPTGGLLDYGRRTYRPPRDLTDHVIARDQTCTFPGCNRPAHRCDLDHEIPASAGGSTSADNLAVLCRRHHRAKHVGGWRVARHETASHWTSPTGHRYRSRPSAYPTDRTRVSDPDPPPF
jgi:hypothetical protein